MPKPSKATVPSYPATWLSFCPMWAYRLKGNDDWVTRPYRTKAGATKAAIRFARDDIRANLLSNYGDSREPTEAEVLQFVLTDLELQEFNLVRENTDV